ncbi:MAG TPA: sugar ABC transporter substrate-binding protein [Methylomirabilota bacterium]
MRRRRLIALTPRNRRPGRPTLGWLAGAVALSALVVAALFGPAGAQGFNWKRYAGTEIRVFGPIIPQLERIKAALPQFEQLTGMKVTLETFPDAQLRQKTLIEATAGAGTLDVVADLPMQIALRFWKAGWLEPLDEYLANRELTSPEYDQGDFLAGPWEIGKLDGRLIAIPFSPQTHLLFYRKDLFEKYSVKPPETLEEMEQAAKRIREAAVAEGQKDLYGVVFRGKKAEAVTQLSYYLYNFGGSWLDDHRQPAIATPAAVRAIDFYGRMLRLYGPPGALNYGFPEASALFMQGRAAMFTDINVLAARIEDPTKSQVAGKVGYSLIPVGPDGRRVPMLPVTSWMVLKQSKAKEAAWLFVQWATNKENLLQILIAGSASPRQSSWNDPRFRSQDKHPDWSRATMEGIRIGKPFNLPPVVAVGEVRDAIGSAIQASILGQDVKAAAERAAVETKKIMDATE